MKNLLRILLFLLPLLAAGPLHAGPKQPVYDSASPVKLRQPSAELQKKYYEDQSYIYDRAKRKGDGSIVEKIREWFRRLLYDKTSTESGRNSVTTILVIVAGFLLVVCILVLLRADIRAIFSRRSKEIKQDLAMTSFDVDIHGVDFIQRIAEAEGRGDYKLAVRLWFLRILKSLSDKDQVFFRPDKTNYDYYIELRGTAHQPAFRELSLVYDHIWYGDFPVDEKMYRQAEELFQKFNRRVEA